jgi:nitrogen-specific signal transduction histidine kinase
MEHKSEENLRLLQLEFVGKILAGFTHDIKNYIAIIKESAGLIEDIIKIEKTPKNKSEQYIEIIRSIEEQIQKTNDLFRYLNRFAHRMDTQLAAFNINESLEELFALIQRVANQKKITLARDFQRDIPSVYSNPSIFQFLIFSFLEERMTNLDKNSIITVKTGIKGSSVGVNISSEGVLRVGQDVQAMIPPEIRTFALQKLTGDISESNGNILITLPVSR